jgi:hypothetical protein
MEFLFWLRKYTFVDVAHRRMRLEKLSERRLRGGGRVCSNGQGELQGEMSFSFEEVGDARVNNKRSHIVL